MTVTTNLFYTDLPLNVTGLDQLLGKEKLFKKVPGDWHIVITDIKNSTVAVLEGKHQTVNYVATGSIVTVLNIANKRAVEVPFFFGGDGATFIVPPQIIDEVMQALTLYKTNTQTNFKLEIRAGTIAVDKIYNDGHDLRIAKHSRSSVFSIPVILGDGLDHAEKLIKGEGHLPADYPLHEDELDLTGMQCRWDRIAPPGDEHEVVSLLVTVQNGQKQGATLKKVMQKIEEIYGTQMQRQPISVTRLRLNTTFNNIRTEIVAQFGGFYMLKTIKAFLINAYGIIWFRTQRGQQYLQQLVEMSDTLIIDGKINTIISGTALQRKKLEDSLARMEAGGEVFYGLHTSSASVMSCYVRNLDDGHIHFVDGSEGGYTQASKILKRKMKSLSA